MSVSGLKLLQDEWQKLVDEREGVLRDVHQRKITFMEWNKRERAYAIQVEHALTRLKHAQARAFCSEMVGRNPN